MANSDPQEQRSYRKRVVITGLGAITPIGNTLAEYWDGLVSGRNGIGPITHFDAAKHDCPDCRRKSKILTPSYI